MQNTLASRKWLEQLTREATLLDEAIKNLKPLPITQMQVSDLIIKVGHQTHLHMRV